MNNSQKYTNENISKIYEILHSFYNTANAIAYEIRIDSIVVVTRTKEVSNFYTFKDFLDRQSSELNIILYKGASRKNDKYTFYLNDNQSPNPELSRTLYVAKKIEKALAKQKKRFKYQKLKEKSKDQELMIIDLKEEIKELRNGKKGNSQMFTQLLSKFATPSPASNDNNNEMKDPILEQIIMARAKYGDQILGKSMGIALKCAEHPKIMDDVIQFITHKISNDEEE